MASSSSSSACSFADLCSGKFSILLEYFEGYTIQEVRDLCEEALLTIAKPAHRIRMKQFVDEHLSPENDIFGATQKPPSSEKLRNRVLMDGGTLDLRFGLLPTKMAHLKKARPDLTSMKDFVKEVGQEWSDEERRRVNKLNFTGALLFDDDFQHVFDLACLFPQCAEVNLSATRLHGLDSPLFDRTLCGLLRRVEFVNLSHTSFATLDKRDFLFTAHSDHLKKLIWIPQPSLEGCKWKPLIPESNHTLVIQTHKGYYKSAFHVF